MADETPENPPASGRGWTVLFLVSVVLLIMVVSFGVGLIAERTVFSRGGIFDRSALLPDDPFAAEPDTSQAFPRLAEVKALLEAEYFFRPESPEAAATFAAELDQDALAAMAVAAATPATSISDYRQGLEYAGIHGMTGGLEDDYTVFLEPAIQAPLAEGLRGEYEGIGVVVNQPEGRITVVNTFPGSPAEAAGLLINDVIVAADGTILSELEPGDALNRIRGPAGTTVLLTIERPGEDEPFEIEVERRAIITPSVNYEPVGDGTIAWIQVGIFGDKTTAELDDVLKQARDDGVSGIILDLRSNGGGWVLGAQEVIGRFVADGTGPALYEDHQPGTGDELEPKPIISGSTLVDDIPLVVLMNEGTASAAEIVAGALRYYDRADLVGTNSFGKGSVQRVHDFPDGSSARITSAQWLTPDQAPIPDDGLVPDVLVEQPPADEDEPEDVQLNRAIELLTEAGGGADSAHDGPVGGFRV